MSILQNNTSDFIVDLPTDKNQPTHAELKVINSLFTENNSFNIKNILVYLLLGFLILIFYFIPNSTLLNYLPSKFSNDSIIYIIKTILILTIFYFIYGKQITFSS